MNDLVRVTILRCPSCQVERVVESDAREYFALKKKDDSVQPYYKKAAFPCVSCRAKRQRESDDQLVKHAEEVLG